MTNTLEYAATPARRPFDWRAYGRFALAAGLVGSIELGCARLAWHTLGEVTSAMCFVAVLAGNCLVMGCGAWNRRMGWILMLALGALVIPYQTMLGYRWWRVEDEARSIVAYAQACKAATGAYPANLNGYTFRRPWTRQYIGYSATAGQPCHVDYHVGATSTSHWWEPAGGWGYHPD